MENNDENKKNELKFEDYKYCLGTTELENKINYLEKNKIYVNSLYVFTEQIKIALSANDEKRIQSIDSKETYVYGISKDLVCKKEEIKYNNIRSNTKMINFDDVSEKNIKEHN